MKLALFPIYPANDIRTIWQNSLGMKRIINLFRAVPKQQLIFVFCRNVSLIEPTIRQHIRNMMELYYQTIETEYQDWTYRIIKKNFDIPLQQLES
uniref:Uncharacterized protein n=1 Tax=Onchocerca volvulus TaxID=6282 RepID=A0A8R1XXG0_ONCVO